MKYLKKLLYVACLGFACPVVAQETGKAMTFENLIEWNCISSKRISDDGKWVTCQMEPWIGDATVRLYNAKGEETISFCPAGEAAFSSSSHYLLTVGKPSVKETDSLKLKKTKEDEMPMNKLIIYHLSGKQEMIDSLRNYRLAESVDWVAYQRGRKDSTLYVRSMDRSKTFRFPSVTEYKFAKKSGMLFYISAENKETQSGLFVLDLEKGLSVLIKEGKGVFRQATFDEQGNRLAFLYCTDKDSVYKALDLWLSENNAPARLIASRGNKVFPADWVVSENGELEFSKNATCRKICMVVCRDR